MVVAARFQLRTPGGRRGIGNRRAAKRKNDRDSLRQAQAGPRGTSGWQRVDARRIELAGGGTDGVPDNAGIIGCCWVPIRQAQGRLSGDAGMAEGWVLHPGVVRLGSPRTPNRLTTNGASSTGARKTGGSETPPVPRNGRVGVCGGGWEWFDTGGWVHPHGSPRRG